MKNNKHGKDGFTLVEIMIVIAIIGLLAAIAIPNYAKCRERAYMATCVNNLQKIDGAMSALRAGPASRIATRSARSRRLRCARGNPSRTSWWIDRATGSPGPA